MDKPSNYFLKIIVVYLHCGSSLGGSSSSGGGGGSGLGGGSLSGLGST